MTDGDRLPTVCVVDDDAPLRRAIQRLLRSAGFAVEAFGSAEEYLSTAHEPPPDCLVLDVRMGGLTGFELYERLRALGVTIPAIFITAHDDSRTREAAHRAGAAGYLRKPFEDTSLIGAIEAVLRFPASGSPPR